MAIYKIAEDSIEHLDSTTFAEQGIRERFDIQRLLRRNIAAVAPDCYVIAEEYGEWEGAKRRVDLLCIDKQANLVVVEIKRTEDGGHMELQAIRYAAMVSKMTFAQAEEAHGAYLQRIGVSDDPRTALLAFLGWDEVRESEFAQDVRIVLVSAEFSKEITTAVMWLSEYDLDIRCVKLRPYRYNGTTLLDIQQVLPLPEAATYQVQLKKKAAEERQSKDSGADWTRYDLFDGEHMQGNLVKRQLFLQVFKALVAKGVSPDVLVQQFPDRKFIVLSGEHSEQEFQRRASGLTTSTGNPLDLRRFFTTDEALIRAEGKTYAVSKMWSRDWLPSLDKLLAEHRNSGVRYAESSED